MAEEDLAGFDPGRFIIAGPVWYLSPDAAAAARSPGEGVTFLTGSTQGGRSYVPLFSDSDLAERFAVRIDLVSAVVIEIPTPPALLSFLQQISEAGHGLLAIDPEPSRALRLATIDSVARAVRESIERQQP